MGHADSEARSFAEELDEVAVQVADAKGAQAQVIEFCNGEVDFDAAPLQVGKNFVKVVDGEAKLEYPVNLEGILDAGESLRERSGFGILDEFENVVVIAKQSEMQAFAHLALFYQMEAEILLIPAAGGRSIGGGQSHEGTGDVVHDGRMRRARLSASEGQCCDKYNH